MHTESSEPAAPLEELKILLQSEQLPVQEEIATAAGVHQSMVSRARRGELKRVTRKVEALLAYARSRAGSADSAIAAADAVDAEVSVIERLSTGRRGGGVAGRAERRRGGPSAEAYRREARDGVESYLKEGYDPRLIIEQLAVLRRAQRLRRPGRLLAPTVGDQVG